MDWIEHDEVAREQLPEWARGRGEVLDGKPYEVSIFSEGLVLVRGRKASAVPWGDVLAPVRLDEPRRLLLAAARRPPRPPWFELGGADVAGIERAVRARLEALEGSYRDRGRHRDTVPPDVVLTRVLARHALPGAVEIPAAQRSMMRTLVQGSVLGSVVGLPFAAGGPLLGLAAASVGALGGAGVLAAMAHLRGRRPGRVLVLTPDGFVAGLDGQSVRAVPWYGVGRFSDGVDEHGASALEVYGPRNHLLARVAAYHFGKPLDVIVAVAEAYRRRASEELG